MKKIVKPIAVLSAIILAASSSAFFASAKDQYDFSEVNMVSNCYENGLNSFDGAIDDGGNAGMALAYLSRWDGPVSESEDPYPESGESTDIVHRELEAQYHIQNAVCLPVRTSYTDNDTIKQAILSYGAVSSSFYCADKGFDDSLTNYYYASKASSFFTQDGGYHAIAIVGWDDNYSKNNFKTKPSGNGAFICKNSWGTESGENGYFYVSYYTATFGFLENTVYNDCESNDNYDNEYQLDTLGATAEYGNVDSKDNEVIYQANVFPKTGTGLSYNQTLCAASFYTYDEGEEYEVYVATDYKGTTSLADAIKGKAVASGNMQYAGYHTVDFSNISLKKGTRFAVIIKTYSSGGATTYIESPIIDYSSNARANPGESFYLDNGKWCDLTAYEDNSNFCIKAFTDDLNDDSSAGDVKIIYGTTKDNCTSGKTYSVAEAQKNGLSFNKSFLEYYKYIIASGGKMSGAVPSIVSVGAKKDTYNVAASLPQKYDLRDYGYLTSVKDQKNIGCCWAFSAYASLESCLLKPEVKAEGMKIANGNTTLNYKGSDILTTVFEPATASNTQIIWYSSDSDVVSVSSSGVISGLKTGSATITATAVDGGYTSSVVVNVKYTWWQYIIKYLLFGWLWY